MPKNDITRSRGEYPGEAGADWEHGATAKPEANEHRKLGGGLRGSDKRQAALRDEDRGTYNQPPEDGNAQERTPHQNLQHGAEVRGQPSMIQRYEDMPEGLLRERKSPLDKNLGRNEEATQVRGAKK